MAITLVTTPDPSAPYTAADYGYQNGLIIANEVPMLSVLDNWELVASEPVIKSGTYIRHANSTYLTSGDETISGTPAAGYNYIEITLTGSTLTAAWVTSVSGYTFNQASGGIYNGAGKQLLPDICYLDGASYIRGRCMGMDYNFVYLASGNFLLSSGFNTLGANIDTSGGDIDTSNGDIEIGTGNINIGSGQLTIDGDNFPSAPSIGSTSISAGSNWVVPKGIYFIGASPTSSPNMGIEHYNGATWDLVLSYSNMADKVALTLPSDGTNTRLLHGGGGSVAISWIKS